MQEQGYDLDASLLYQDNMSAMLLETNGNASSSKQTKHIKVKYFFVKDKIDYGKTSTPNQSKVWYSESYKEMSWASQQIAKTLINSAMCQPSCQCGCYPYPRISQHQRSVLKNK
jgi:hypothetical protein